MDNQTRKILLKNIALLVLFTGMVVLACLVWLSDLSMESVPEDSLLAHVYQRLTYGVHGFELRTGGDPAAEPTRIAVSLEDGLAGAQYHGAMTSTLYATLEGVMGDAFAEEPHFSGCSEEDFAKALRGKVLYFGYEGYLPLSLLSGWLGHDYDLPLRTDVLLLTQKGELYLHTEGGYLCAPVKAGSWQDAEISAAACSFAAAREDGIYANVRPDTLVFEGETQTVEQLSVRYPSFLDTQSGSDLTALLNAFHYDPYVRGYAGDNGQSWVYVETYSTLHVANNGTVEFRASAVDGGLEVYTAGEILRNGTLRLQADFAHTLLKTAQESLADTSQAMLFDVTETADGTRVFTFIQTVGGIPVQSGEQPFAEFEFQGSRLMAAKLHLRAFEPAGIRFPVLPGAQAAAAAPAGSSRVSLAYLEGENGNYTAVRCYQQ